MATVNQSMTVSDSSACLGDAKFFPPGFRFHPTDEELVLYYLKRKICRRRLKLDIIGETDVYKWDPEDLPGLSKLKTGDRQWFFFSPRDRKYPNGGRSNRATMHGYWKATGKDRTISCNSRSIGVKKTLVFYKGRAPSGERTDWVMHEYTLDEEELKRCPAKDYYALYKVYKKSGPGPKNGEQYGAPFIEEEWADDECLDFSCIVDRGNIVKEVNNICVDNLKAGQPQCSLDDLDELLNRIADEPVLVPPLIECGYTLDQLIAEEETSTLVEQSSREVNIPEQSMLLHPSQQHNVQASFDHTQSAISNFNLLEASEVTSASNICQQEMPLLAEDYFEDFLEMDDLIGPEHNAEYSEKPPEALSFGEVDGLNEFDLYHDATMFCNNLEFGMVNVASHAYINNIENETVNYQVQTDINDANQVNSQLWTHDQNSVLTPAEANQEVVHQGNTGVTSNGNPAYLSTGSNQNQSGKEDDGTDSWLSSVLWSFVESIPTTPASASETALVNRAFERMSSFGRARINTRSPIGAAGNYAETSRRSASSRRGILYFSILGVICAILWMMIGTSVKVLGRYVSF